MRNILGSPMGTALHPQLSGSANALTGLMGGLPGAPLARNPSDAGSDHNMSLLNLRSKSPWEGAHGMPAALLGSQQLDDCIFCITYPSNKGQRRPTCCVQ